METINPKDFKTGVIYMYTSPSNKKYIGQTINEKSRKSQHKNLKTDTSFSRAIQKYGFSNFKYEVLIKFKPTSNRIKLKRVLDKLEQRYINLHKSNDPEFGYNLNKGGEGNIGYKHTPEMITYLKTCPKTEEQLKNLEKRGSHKPKTEEHKKYLSTICKTKKKVLQLNTKLEVIAEFDSISDAAKTIQRDATHKTISNQISGCCHNKKPSAFGYIWKFEEWMNQKQTIQNLGRRDVQSLQTQALRIVL